MHFFAIFISLVYLFLNTISLTLESRVKQVLPLKKKKKVLFMLKISNVIVILMLEKLNMKELCVEM